MPVKVLAVGKVRDKGLSAAIADYETRIRRFDKIDITEVPDLPEPSHLTEALATKISEQESQALLARLGPQDTVIALAPHGQTMDSPDFSRMLAGIKDKGQTATFLIGGSQGLSAVVYERAQHVISFSPMTFPHQLFRLMLMEQIYRAYMIEAGRRYHK